GGLAGRRLGGADGGRRGGGAHRGGEGAGGELHAAVVAVPVGEGGGLGDALPAGEGVLAGDHQAVAGVALGERRHHALQGVHEVAGALEALLGRLGERLAEHVGGGAGDAGRQVGGVGRGGEAVLLQQLA